MRLQGPKSRRMSAINFQKMRQQMMAARRAEREAAARQQEDQPSAAAAAAEPRPEARRCVGAGSRVGGLDAVHYIPEWLSEDAAHRLETNNRVLRVRCVIGGKCHVTAAS